MSRGHPNCFEYRYDFFRKVIETLVEIDNEKVLQDALAITISKLEKEDYKKFVKSFKSWGKAEQTGTNIDHREQLKKLGKI